MLKRDLAYELFSREPEDWAEWAGFARDYYTAKREPLRISQPKYKVNGVGRWK